MSVRFSTRLGKTSEDNTEDGLSGNFGTSLLRIYCYNELHDASCKIWLIMPMQDHHAKGRRQSVATRSAMLDSHANDAHLRWMIAMLVQFDDGLFHAQ